MEDNSTRADLIGNRYVIRKGHFIIDGDDVSLSMRMSYGNIDCRHVVGHLDNQCPEAKFLQMFDKAVGGIATQRGWDYVKFPVWHFSKLPPQPGERRKLESPRRAGKGLTSAMIARTDADCHGNVVDGDQLQADLDVSPRTAADYRGPISYQLAEALSDLDELFGREVGFFDSYHAACLTIAADKYASDDFFFTAQTDAARNVLAGMRRNSYRIHDHMYSRGIDIRKSHSQLVKISELSPRRFKKLMFTASVFVLEKLRQRPLTRFSQLREELVGMFALCDDFASGLLCRMLPKSNIIGLNKCAFAHAKKIDAEGRVVLDVELTLKDVFFGEDSIYGKVLDRKTVVVRGSELDDVCVVLERQETLHVVEVRPKSPADSVDSAFRIVQDPRQLIVGSPDDVTLLRQMSLLSNDKLIEAASQTSSAQRAIRILCSFCNKGSKPQVGALYRSIIYPTITGHLVCTGDQPHFLRTAMVSGMLEASDEAKVEKVMRSIHAIVWTRAIRKVVADVYMKKITRHVKGDYTSDILIRVSTTGSEIQAYESYRDAVLFSSSDVVRVAALIRAGIALGMRIERPIGTIFMEGNGRDRMILTVGDDVMNLATQSKFGDGTPPFEEPDDDTKPESADMSRKP